MRSGQALPLLVPTAAVYAGWVFSSRWESPSIGYGAVALVLLWLLWEWRELPGRYVLFLITAGSIASCLCSLAGPIPDWNNTEGAWTAEVLSIETFRSYRRVVVDADHLGLAAAHLDLANSPEPGQYITLRGRSRAPQGPANPGEFDYRRYLDARGIHWIIEADDWHAVSTAEHTPGLSKALQERLGLKLRRLADGSLVQALILGDRTGIGPQKSEQWQRLGIAHLMAISGLHIGLIGGLLWVPARFLPVNPWVQLLIVLVGLLCYVMLSGLRPSALRAFCVFALAGSARIKNGSGEPLNHWAAAALLLILWQPGLPGQLGFQMSFAASGAIIYLLPAIRRLRRWLWPFAISAAAQAGLVPLLADAFGEIALLGALFTWVFLPLITVLLAASLLWVLTGSLLDFCLIPVLDGMTAAIYWIAEISQAVAITVPLPSFSLVSILLWYGFWLFVGSQTRSRCFVKRRSLLAKVALVAVVLALLTGMPRDWLLPLEVTAIDVGQGDSLLIQTPHGQNILIDGGGSHWEEQSDYGVGPRRLLPYLRRRGIDHIDLVILSHPHEDHLQGLLTVLEELSVGMVWDGGDPHTTRSYIRYLELIETKGVPYHVVRTGQSVSLAGGVKLSIEHPSELEYGTSSDLNNNSVVVLLEYRSRRFLFTGDIDWEGQIRMLRSGVPSVDWLKVPHHGSASAWLEPWIEAVSPSIALISAGEGNRFGHPHAKVVEGLKEREVEVYRTDIHGSVRFFVWNGIMWTWPSRMR